MASPAGFEPATPSLEGWCSIQLSYGLPYKVIYNSRRAPATYVKDMPIFEFKCLKCDQRFETLVRATDSEPPQCSKCQSNDLEKLITSFKVGGRGDLRESTFHGCHDHNVPMKGDSSPEKPAAAGHKCSSGCEH